MIVWIAIRLPSPEAILCPSIVGVGRNCKERRATMAKLLTIALVALFLYDCVPTDASTSKTEAVTPFPQHFADQPRQSLLGSNRR